MNSYSAVFFLFALSVANCLLKSPNTKLGKESTPFTESSTFDTNEDRENKVEDILFRYYPENTVDEFVEIKLLNAEELLTQKNFNKEKPTVFYIDGYLSIANSTSVRTVVSAYLKAKPDDNIVLVDWSNMNMGGYFTNAAPNTRKVAQAVAGQVKKLIDIGLNEDGIHFVGHSLGGQTVGFVGKEMKELGHKLKRISALDPAFPFFYPGLILGHIEDGDADFVDVIHTDAGFYGAPVSTGTADFWPNEGRRIQPGCKPGIHLPFSDDDLCSHWRSWYFWAESVEIPTNFPSVRREQSGIVYMGYAADERARGNYYLRTNDNSPFGMGIDGIGSNTTNANT